MNNEMLFFTIFGVLCGSAGFFAYRVHGLIVGILEVRRRRREFPYVVDAEPDLLCNGPHKWDEITLALGEYTGPYTVCSDCGYVSSDGDHMLNKPALEVYKNNLKRRAEREAKWALVYKMKQDRSNEIMNQLIKSHVSLLGPDLHQNIEVMQQFFRKSNIELDSLYSTLNKSLEEK